MGQGIVREFYVKSRKNKATDLFITLINPFLFFTAFLISSIKSYKNGNAFFVVFSSIISALFLITLVIGLASRLRGRNNQPDLKISEDRIVLFKGPIRKPRIIAIDAIRNVKIPSDGGIIELILEDGEEVPIHSALYAREDLEELKDILKQIAGLI